MYKAMPCKANPFESSQAINHWLEHWSLTYADERLLNDCLNSQRAFFSKETGDEVKNGIIEVWQN